SISAVNTSCPARTWVITQSEPGTRLKSTSTTSPPARRAKDFFHLDKVKNAVPVARVKGTREKPERLKMLKYAEIRRDPHDAAFDAHWKRIMNSPGIVNKTILRGDCALTVVTEKLFCPASLLTKNSRLVFIARLVAINGYPVCEQIVPARFGDARSVQRLR